MSMELPIKLRIEQAGAAILHQPARAVSAAELTEPAVQCLIDAMFATLHGTGVGLAAPQIGVGLRLVVIEDPVELHQAIHPDLLRDQERVPVEPHVLVNPRLDVLDPAAAEFFEGCLSIEGYRAVVPRARRVRVTALDRAGHEVARDASGWYARIVQHEVDHLDGRLYPTRMRPRTLVSAASYAQHWSKTPIDEVLRALDSR
jgi:peptide deformylase